MNNAIIAHWKSLKQKMAAQTAWQTSQNKNKNRLIFLCLFVFIGCIMYLWQINGLATKSYQIKDLEGKLSELKDENKKLQVEITELRSITRLNERVKKLNMQEVSRLEYLSATGSVALNR